jgi:hypothetical protein
MPPTLYLFKSARRPLYRKENLHLLAAERGSIVELAYNRMWVAPHFFDATSIPRGTHVNILFTERPYDFFVPVRDAEVVEVVADELMLRLRVVLHSWIGIEDRDLADFTRLVKATDPTLAPGTKFVVPKRDGVELRPYYDEREDEGWRRVVDRVLELSARTDEQPYRRSVFFRAAGLRIGDELHVARRVPLEPGRDATLLLRFYNPHLSDADVEQLALQVLAPPDVLEAHFAERFPTAGDVEVALRTLGPDPSLTLQIGPGAAQHTSITERFSTRAARSRAASSRPAVVKHDLLRVCDLVLRDGANAADPLEVIDAFERLLPDEPRVLERKACLLAARGREAEAFRILRALDPETMGDGARLLRFRLLAAHDAATGAVAELVLLDLLAEARFERLLDVLADMPARPLAVILPRLAEELPVEQLRALVERLGGRLESPDAIADLAWSIAYASGDGRWAYSWLHERQATLHLTDPVVADAMIELAEVAGIPEGDPDLVDAASHRLLNLIEAGRIDDARARLTRLARTLTGEARARLYSDVADRLERHRAADEAAHLLVELAEHALAAGDLDAASDAVERANGVWTRAARSGEEAPAWLHDCVTRVTDAWKRCGELAEWRRSADEKLEAELRARYLNGRLLIAGGVRQPQIVERLEQATGAKVDWAESFRTEVADLDGYAARLANGTYAAVLHLWRKTGHGTGDRLKGAAEGAGALWLPVAGVGAQAMIRALGDGGAGERV